MPTRGRQRLTPEQLEARTREYCRRYGVTASASGLPPFPSGRRETQQHREWMAVYKAHQRLSRRARGECERCAAPASDGSVFCEAHRAGASGRSSGQDVAALDGCPVCGRRVAHRKPGTAAALHGACRRLAGLAKAAGPETVDRLRSYLWPNRPEVPRSPIRGRRAGR
jgi:hypothetical protein